jgi:hypothetical protein
MTRLQQKAFKLASKHLTPGSRFYQEDLDDLKRFWSQKSDQSCLETIERMTCEPMSEKEMRQHCQFGGLF